jgi:phosphate transport system ATP-binding protein
MESLATQKHASQKLATQKLDVPKLKVEKLNVWYGKQHALKDISVAFPTRQITAIIGPSGCGKSTLLKSLNRLLELNEAIRIEGRVLLDGEDIYAPGVDVTEIRSRIGLLAQKPFPLPMSIYDNVAFGPRLHGIPRSETNETVARQLQAVGLWSEVEHRLKAPAAGLSVGQQQRLCLARALAVAPEVLLCDESTASLDPISARGIESLLRDIRNDYTVIMVTHDIDQARRLADHVVFMWLGELIEQGEAGQVFNNPQHELTQEYFARRIG